MKKQFTLIADLGPLSETARTQYLRDLSEHIGLDPDTQTLGTVWLDNEGGGRNLVAYVRRADAERLRDIHGISVTGMTVSGVLGEIIFVASGTDKNGRTETAVGSHQVEGLRGERRSYAVMTASTRALRRLTLQFVGAGLYDESEVNPTAANMSSSGASGAQLAGSPAVIPPVPAAPNPESGKDITEAQKLDPEPEKPKRRRRTNTVDLQPPALPTKEEAAGYIENLKTEQPMVQVSAPVAPAPVPLAAASVAEPKPPQVVQPVVASLSPEKKAEYTARLNKYCWEVLPSGGMTNDENLGVSAKLRKFAIKLVGATGTQLATEDQYIEVLEFLDGYLATKGAKELVSYIESSVNS